MDDSSMTVAVGMVDRLLKASAPGEAHDAFVEMIRAMAHGEPWEHADLPGEDNADWADPSITDVVVRSFRGRMLQLAMELANDIRRVRDGESADLLVRSTLATVDSLNAAWATLMRGSH